MSRTDQKRPKASKSAKAAKEHTAPQTSGNRPPPSPPKKSFPIVGVGASAGGLEAFTALLKHLPLNSGMGFVLVQHLDPQHESALTQLLARATSLPVREVTNNLRVEANHVYVIPPNTNMIIAPGILKLQPRETTAGAHRSIDFFLSRMKIKSCKQISMEDVSCERVSK